MRYVNIHNIYIYIYIYTYIYVSISSKEVGKQYFRVTNDFYLMELTMMKGGARVRLDLDEGWCETLSKSQTREEVGVE